MPAVRLLVDRMRAARPLLREADPEAEGLYRVIQLGAACAGAWDEFAPKGDTSQPKRAWRTRVAAATCSECPVLLQCSRLAEITQPTAGIWAGRLHSPFHPEGVLIT